MVGAGNRWTATNLVILGAALLVASMAMADAPSGSLEPRQVARQIDGLIAQELWRYGNVKPTSIVDDLTFLRRVTIDVIGRPPTPDEIRRFSQDQSAQKRTALIDRLLSHESYGQNWAEYWRDVVMYRRSEDRALVASRAMTEKLTADFNNNRGWDEVATEFITATGDVRENGATALIFAQLARPEETAAEVSRVLMGIQIQCAQCHDHPFDNWKREQFHELAAFFPRISSRPKNGDVRSFEIRGVDRQIRRRRANNNRYVPQLEHYMSDLEDPQARGEKTQPAFFVTGQKLPYGMTDAQRRQQLADWIVSPTNPWFATAIVNRMWTELIGAGFYDTVDDLGPDRECRAEQTLALLVDRFVASGHDLKWLLRTMMNTEAYQRECRSRDPGDEIRFAHTYPHRLRGDQLFRAITQAIGLPNMRRTAGRRGPQMGFSQSFGFDPSLSRDEVSSTVPQALALMNSPIIEKAIGARRGVVNELLRGYPQDSDLIDQIYIQCFSRWPSRGEIAVAIRHIRSAENRIDGARDVMWALVNSTEFLFRK